jgi:hypothetical protein
MARTPATGILPALRSFICSCVCARARHHHTRAPSVAVPRTTRKKEKKTPPRTSPTQASQANRYTLYQHSVQNPESEIEFMVNVYREHFGARPHVLREDFCAAAWLCCEWVKDNRENVAYGLDIDPEPIEWGLEHNAEGFTDTQLTRLHLLEQDVLEAVDFKADIIYAGNFSYNCFHTREALGTYFRAVRAGMNEKSLFVMDLFGGPDAQRAGEEETEHEGFTYIWDQAEYNPVANHILCHIHFRFDDNSEMEKAFTYDWRLWTIPELRELLDEAGFSSSGVYWEGTTSAGEGDGEFSKVETVENEDAWIAYIVARP